MKKGEAILALVFFGGIALFLLWRAGNICYDINQMKHWAPHEARLLSVKLDVKEDSGDDPDTYRTIVSYQYRVDGKTYMGDRVSFGYIHSNMGRHFQVTEKIKYAKKVRVWVDPRNPGESALAQGWSETAFFFMVFTFIWTCGAIGSIFWGMESASASLRTWGKIFVGLAVTAFVLFFCRMALLKYNDAYSIKLEDKIEVIAYAGEEEIKREKLLEKAEKEAFRRAEAGQDTVRIRLDKDTFYVK